jgi:hypothetical protein
MFEVVIASQPGCSQSAEGRMSRQQKLQQPDQIMCLGHVLAKFLQKRFEKFLG